MKRAIMLKTKRYKFGFVLAKDEEVLIEEAYKGHSDGFYANEPDTFVLTKHKHNGLKQSKKFSTNLNGKT